MYRVVRCYFNQQPNGSHRRVIKRGLTLEAAQEHCRDPETSSSSARGSVARRRTARMGAWFDGFEEGK